MKKLFVQSVCIGIALSFFVGVGSVGAQEANETSEQSTSQFSNPLVQFGYNLLNTQLDMAQNVPGQVGIAATAAQAGLNAITPGSSEQGFLERNGFNLIAGLRHGILTGLWKYAQGLAWVTGAVGQLFDGVILKITPTTTNWNEASATGLAASVLNQVKLDGIQTGITVSWKIVRDLANIIIVFSLLYLGIRTIIGGKGFADKKTLGAIIIAAILVNFSLVLTRDVAFHVSNKVGIEIFQQLKFKDGEQSFTAAMLNSISPQILFENNAKPPHGGDWDHVFDTFGKTIFLSFILFVSIAIFIGMIAMLIYRFVIFVFLMIVSPLGLVAFAIPWLKSHGQKWVDELKKQTIFFPAFVFCMYIVYVLIGQLVITVPFNSSESTIGALVSFFFNFLLIIAFMLILLVLPMKIGGMGSDLVSKAGNWGIQRGRNALTGTGRFAGRTATSAIFGSAAALGRNTVGRYSAKILDSKKLKGFAQAKGFTGGAYRAMLRGADKAQNYSFDARATKAGGAFAKKYGLGDAQKGWTDTVKAKQKAFEEQAKKEKKLFGLDKLSDVDKETLATQKMERSIQEDKLKDLVKEHKKDYDTKSESEKEAGRHIIKLAENRLKELEKAVGETMNAADKKYFENIASQPRNTKDWIREVSNRAARKVSGGKIDRLPNSTKTAALENMKKDMEKKIESDGQSAAKKKQRLELE